MNSGNSVELTKPFFEQKQILFVVSFSQVCLEPS